MNKRDILFVGIASVETDASQHKLYFLATALARRGLKVSVLVPSHPENVAFFPQHGQDIETIFFPPCSPWQEMWTKFILCGRGEWSCVYIVGVGVRSLISRRRLRGRPKIIQDFDELPSLIDTFSPLRRKYLQAIENFLWSRADGFVCASRFLVNEAHRRRPELDRAILALPVAIAPEECQAEPALATALRHQDQDRPLYLYVGSMNRFYQIDELIELAKILRAEQSTAFISVLGGGPDLDYLRASAVTAKVTNWIGFAGHIAREQLASYLAAADVLLFPFHNTPFNVSRCPTKAFHYAAANRPVVTNRLGEVEALLGETAFYYREADIKDMADACRRAMVSREKFSNGIALESLTWDRRAATFLDWLYDLGWLAPEKNLAETGRIKP